MKYRILLSILYFLCIGCTTKKISKNLATQIHNTSERFFEELLAKTSAGNAYFTLFIPDSSVNKRHMLRFRKNLEQRLRSISSKISLHYNGSPDKVFFLSSYKAKTWKVPPDMRKPGELLANEFLQGTDAGWTIFHTFWGQYNRLLVGDSQWIQSLPDSVRTDLAHPLTYVLRIHVTWISSPSITTHNHTISYSFIKVGSEEVVFSKSYPLVLTFQLP